jgi:hypothetical protein
MTDRIRLADVPAIADLSILDPADADSWTPIDLSTLPEHPPVQPTLGRVGDIGLVYPGKRHVFSGPQESAKTLAAYALGIQVIRDGGTLVLIDFEMGAYEARGRLRDLGATTEDLNGLRYLEPDQPATPERLQALLALQPALVIIDAAAGAYELQGLDDNKRQDVGKITRLYVERFWKAGVATLFIDHVVKNADNRGNYAIGSERKIAGVDVHLGFEVITPISRGHSGLYKIITKKDRGGYLKRGTLAELELTSDPHTHQIQWTFRPVEETPQGETWMPTKVMEKISTRLQLAPEPVSRANVIAEIGGRKEVAIKAIDHLVRLEYLTETAGPRGAKLLEPTRHFTVHEWETQPDPPPVPTRSHPFPERVISPVPTCSPPYGGTGTGDGDPERPPVPEFQPHFGDWIDDLSASENGDPPADLHEPTPTPDDDIPF